MDKTYAETKKLPPFDWNKALDNALKIEPDEDEYKHMYKLSHNWATCACGNQCAIIPRLSGGFYVGEPLDEILSTHGQVFMQDITERRWQDAKDTLLRIEERSTQLIKVELAKLS